MDLKPEAGSPVLNHRTSTVLARAHTHLVQGVDPLLSPETKSYNNAKSWSDDFRHSQTTYHLGNALLTVLLPFGLI